MRQRDWLSTSLTPLRLTMRVKRSHIKHCHVHLIQPSGSMGWNTGNWGDFISARSLAGLTFFRAERVSQFSQRHQLCTLSQTYQANSIILAIISYRSPVTRSCIILSHRHTNILDPPRMVIKIPEKCAVTAFVSTQTASLESEKAEIDPMSGGSIGLHMPSYSHGVA